MTDTTSSPYLKVENIVKKFGCFTALNNISLEIFESEFVCFLGPSGCGKTTLLRAIAGLDIQTSGTIKQAGKDISTLPPSERDFGIVFQSYALFPNLTVHRNVAYGLENKGMAKPDIVARVKGCCNSSDFPIKVINTPPSFPAANSRLPWHGRWQRRQACCFWTSP